MSSPPGEIQAKAINTDLTQLPPGVVPINVSDIPPLPPPPLLPPGEAPLSVGDLPPPPPIPPDVVPLTVADLPPPPPLPPGSVPLNIADLLPHPPIDPANIIGISPLPRKRPRSPPTHILISKNKDRISLPLRAAILSSKIKREGHSSSETQCAIDTETLYKIVPYMIRHSGCTDADNPPMSEAELEEWDSSVFLKEPNMILLNMLYAALWLQIPSITHLIESKLLPTGSKSNKN